MWTDSTLKIINDNDQYVSADGTTYPFNFPKADIPGLLPVTLTSRPDDSINVVHGFHVDESNTQVWDFTPLTDSQITSRKRLAIISEIDELERNALENRGARELHLREMEREAQVQADAMSTPENPVTAEQVLAAVPYYVKLKALDDQIAALRMQL